MLIFERLFVITKGQIKVKCQNILEIYLYLLYNNYVFFYLRLLKKEKIMMLSNSRPQSITSSKLKITAVLIFVLTALSTVVFSFINSMYMGESYLYVNGAPTSMLIIPVILAVALAGIGASLVKKSDYSAYELPRDKTSVLYMLSLLFVALFLSIFVMYILNGAYDIGYGQSIKGNAELVEKLETLTLFYQIMIVLTPLAPVYFVISAFKGKTNAFFGTLTLLWILAYILRLYFDITDWVMSPRKLSMICAMCFGALFILYEIRFSFARGNVRRYFFVAAMTTVFCFPAGLVGVVSSLVGVYPSPFEIPYYAVAFALGLYGAIRLYSVAFASSEVEEVEEAEEAKVATEGSES